MTQELHILKARMEELAAVEAIIAEARAEFEKRVADAIEKKKALSFAVETAKEAVREQAFDMYEETGNKKLPGGIGIREKSVIEYSYDEALAWAKEKNMFLALDKSTFDKAAPSLGLDFVVCKKVPQVTFPKEVII